MTARTGKQGPGKGTEGTAEVGLRTQSPARLYRLQQAFLRRLRARSYLWLASLAVAVGVATALLHVSVRLKMIRVGYALSQENNIYHELDQQNQRLRLELAMRKDPALIERIARERLKMVPPDPADIRVIRLARDAEAPSGHAPAPRADGKTIAGVEGNR